MSLAATTLMPPRSAGCYEVSTSAPQHGHLMSQGNKLKLQRGAATKAEGEDRNNGGENRHHNRDGTTGPGKSPAFLSLWRFEQDST
jgi:hypothetical protein